MEKIEYSGKEQKLSRFFSSEYPFFGYSYFRKLLRDGDIKINDKRTHEDVVIHAGDVLQLYIKDKGNVFSPTVLYEDDNIVAYYKMKKVPSQGEGSFEELIHRYVDEGYILCHRLDTNTDGILLFAKNEKVFDEIKRIFKRKEIDKYYRAEVYGIIRESGIYKDFIVKNADESRVFVSADRVANSMEAILEYKPLEERENSTVIEIRLITGRTHQIRAQMAFHGHFVIGDGKYGKEEINREFKRKTQQLTAYKLVFQVQEGFLKYLDGKEIIYR